MTDHRSLLVLSEGPFGQALGERLSATQGARVEPLLDGLPVLPDLVRRADFVAVAAWRRYPAALDRVDEACMRSAVPWSGLVLDDRFLVAGPVVVPGGWPCYACYRRRWWTHIGHPERERALETVYDADPGIGPGGFLPSTVSVGAALLASDVADAQEWTDVQTAADRPDVGGRIRRLDLLHCVVDETRVVPVHGCQRCRPSLPGGERYVRSLRAALGSAGE